METGKLNNWIQEVGFCAVVALLIYVGMPVSHSQETAAGQTERSDNNILTTEHWNENIEFVSETLKNHHPDPFLYSDELIFDQKLGELRNRLDVFEDHEVLIELIAAVASLKDGHTAIRGGFSFLSGQFPFQLVAYSDGVFVTSANSDNQRLVGSRLVSIGGVSAEEALARVFTITPHDNPMTQLARAPAFLSIPEAVNALGLAESREHASFVFQQTDGSEYRFDAKPVSFEEKLYWEADAVPSERPLRRQRRERSYWSEYLEDAGLLYVQFNRVRNDDEQSIAEFAAEMGSFEASTGPRCVLLDIRDNGGGNGFLNSPIVEWAMNSASAKRDRFFVAIGRGTFSAAQKLATRLELETDVLFIGEPTGSRPNHFGDSESHQLPHGDLTLSVSSIYWEDAGIGDSRDALRPDIPISESSEDFFGGSDPVLSAVVSRCE